MNKTLYNHTALITLLITTNLSLVHTSDHYQEKEWHKPLVQLYHKSSKKAKDGDVQKTIELLQKSCENIEAVDQINKENITPKKLNKKKLSSKGYDIDCLKIYYLLAKQNENQMLSPDEITIGKKALQNLYYKGTRTKEQEKKSIQEILKKTKKTKTNKNQPDYKQCVIELAQQLNNTFLSNPKHVNEEPNELNTTRRHRTISQLRIQIDSPPSHKTTKSLPLLFQATSSGTPECSSDDEIRIQEVKDFKIKNKKTVLSENDITNLTNFEKEPEELRSRYRNSIELNMQQKDELKRLSETTGEKDKQIEDLDKKLRTLNQQYKGSMELNTQQQKELTTLRQQEGEKQQRIAQLSQELTILKQREGEKEQTTKKQNEKSHAVQYVVSIIIGTFIGIAIDQGIHKARANNQVEQGKAEEVKV